MPGIRTNLHGRFSGSTKSTQLAGRKPSRWELSPHSRPWSKSVNSSPKNAAHRLRTVTPPDSCNQLLNRGPGAGRNPAVNLPGKRPGTSGRWAARWPAPASAGKPLVCVRGQWKACVQFYQYYAKYSIILALKSIQISAKCKWEWCRLGTANRAKWCRSCGEFELWFES